MGGHTFEYLQKVLLDRGMEIRTKEEGMHLRADNSKHIAHAFRGLDALDWSLNKDKFKNNYMINE